MTIVSSFSSFPSSLKRECPEKIKSSQSSKQRKLDPALGVLVTYPSFTTRTLDRLKVEYLVETTETSLWKLHEANPVVLKPFLNQNSILAPFINPIKTEPQPSIEIPYNLDLSILELVNQACQKEIINKETDEFNLDFSQLSIPDIHTCFKIFQIADWLEIPALFAKIDDFLESYLMPLTPQLNLPIKQLLKLPDFQTVSQEGQRAYLKTMHTGFNTDLKDVLLWYKNENLPKAHAVAEQKIQKWLQSPSDIGSIIEKCQLLRKRNIYLDHLDLSQTGETLDEHVNQIIACQPHIKSLDLSNTGVEGNINLKQLSQLHSFRALNAPSLADALGPNLPNSLTTLSLHKGQFSNALGAYLTPLPLETLKIIGSPNLTNEFGAHLAQLPLKHLSVTNCKNLSNDFIKHLVHLKLESFTLIGSPITDACGADIACFSPNLKRLELSACELLTDGFATSLVNMQKLETLILINCNFRNLFGASIAHLKLKNLNMAGNEELDNGFGEHVSKMTELIDLDMSETLVDEEFGHSIENLRLKSLRMHHCIRLGSAFGNFLINMPLRNLDLSNCSKFTHLDFLAHLTDLQTLNIRGCHLLKNDSVQSLQHLRYLTYLDVSECYQLNSQVGQYFIHSPLETLLMDGCFLLSDAIGDFLVQIPSLKDLDLSHCLWMTPHVLSSINSLPYLQFLRMVGCQLPASFKENITSEQLHFINNDLSEEEVSESEQSDEDLTDDADFTDTDFEDQTNETLTDAEDLIDEILSDFEDLSDEDTI